MSDPLIVVRALHFASTIMVAGALAFSWLVADPVLRRLGPSAPSPVSRFRQHIAILLWVNLILAVATAAIWLLLLAAQISGRPLTEVLSDDVAWAVLTGTQFGCDWQARLVLAVLLGGSLLVLDPQGASAPRWQGAIPVALAACLLGALAWAGHSGATEGISGDIHLAADVLHLLAAGTWIGALVPLAALLAFARRGVEPEWAVIARDVTLRFSTLGVASVATLVATGTVNTWFLAGSVPALVGTDYGRLLLLKIALFIGMVSLAAVNRLRLTPRLAGSAPEMQKNAVARLIRNSLVETGLGLAIVAVVGGLGTLPPGLHVQPLWPFPVRLTGEAFTLPELRTRAIVAIAAATGGALFLLTSIFLRRLRCLAFTAGLIIIGYGSSIFYEFYELGLLTEGAYPTTFYTSPTGYSAQSIARGKVLFAEHCAACHGQGGRGDGPAAKDLPIKPPDLTEDHIYTHSDGDLFWWITNGMADLMPGFGSALDDEERWDLIDFVRANADAARLGSSGAGTGETFAAPDFSAECPDGSTVSIKQLRGRIIHVVFAGARSEGRLRSLTGLNLGSDVTNIVVWIDASIARPVAMCAVVDPAVSETFAVYRDSDAGQLEGTEFLVGPAGELRSMWYPGLGQDWSVPDVLRREIEEVRGAPASRPSSHGDHKH